jgi:hypothetical protein
MICPYRKAKNPDGAKFCGKCGQAIELVAQGKTKEVSEGIAFDDILKWIGLAVVGLVLLSILSNC